VLINADDFVSHTSSGLAGKPKHCRAAGSYTYGYTNRRKRLLSHNTAYLMGMLDYVSTFIVLGSCTSTIQYTRYRMGLKSHVRKQRNLSQASLIRHIMMLARPRDRTESRNEVRLGRGVTQGNPRIATRQGDPCMTAEPPPEPGGPNPQSKKGLKQYLPCVIGLLLKHASCLASSVSMLPGFHLGGDVEGWGRLLGSLR
jgi:hypothetical protein